MQGVIPYNAAESQRSYSPTSATIPTCGMYKPATNQLGFSANGALVALITAAGLAITGVASATSFSGPLTGNVTGNVSGSSGSCTGNAATATLATTASAVAVGGITGLGTNVGTWLATPSSANLLAAVTDETGTGALVFANTPTLVTPVIGAATGTSLSLTTTLTLVATSSSTTGVIYKGANRFIHDYAAASSDGLNTFIGVGAGNFTMSQGAGATSLASKNTIVGSAAFTSNTTGYNNAALGQAALGSNTTGYNNMAVGTGALYVNSTGYNNMAVGRQALFYNSTGYSNVAIGDIALYFNDTGFSNVAIGANALTNNTTGYLSVAIGADSLKANTTGAANTTIGSSALTNVTTGNANTAVGYATGLGITTGGNNTILGANVTGLAAGLSSNIILANGAGTIKAQHDGTAWAFTGAATFSSTVSGAFNGTLGATTPNTVAATTMTASGVAALTTAAESWVGPSTTTGVYFKGGLVGVGTITPASILDVKHVNGSLGLIVRDNNGNVSFSRSNASGYLEIVGSSGLNGVKVTLAGSATQMLFLDSSGNLTIAGAIAIGSGGYTTTGNALTRGLNIAFYSNALVSGAYDAGIMFRNGGSGAKSAIQPNAGKLDFYTTSTDTTFDSTMLRMTLDTSGYLGIGTSSPAAVIDMGGNVSASSWTTSGIGLKLRGNTYTDSSTAVSGTAVTNHIHAIAAPTLAATNATVTTTTAATLYIAGAPTAGTNMTITNRYGLYVQGTIVAATAYVGGGVHLQIGTTLNTGFRSVSANIIAFDAQSSERLRFNNTSLVLGDQGTLGWSSTTDAGVAADTFIGRQGTAATLQLGAANAASPVAQTLQAQGSRSGTDTNVGGGNLTLKPGASTGNATPSTIILQAPVAVASGSGAQTMTTCVTISGLRATMSLPFALKGYTVAGLPAGTVGDMAYATDLLTPAFLVAAVGGGAIAGPVFYNGSAWVSF